MSCSTRKELLEHQGHNIVIARYEGIGGEPNEVYIECEDCWEVLVDMNYLLDK